MATDIKAMIQQKRDEAEKAMADAKQLELIEQLLSDASTRKILEDQLGVHDERKESLPLKPPAGGAGLAKLKAYMKSNHNEPITLVRLSEAVEMKVQSIRQIMSKTKAFKKVGVLPGKKALYQLDDFTNDKTQES